MAEICKRRDGVVSSCVREVTMSIILCMFCMVLINRAQAINSVLDLKGAYPYLLDNQTGRVVEPRDYMDLENLYAPNETYKLKTTAQERNYQLIKAFDFANYFKSDYWHYSSREDLMRSAQPVADARECPLHLDWLEGQMNRSQGEALFLPGEQHINLMTVVDSFGRPETNTYYGHGYWLGSYHECTRASVDRARYQLEECLRGAAGDAPAKSECEKQQQQQQQSNNNSTLRFRYCIGKARDVDWDERDRYVPKISYKVGLCLPETCETLSYARHAAQIERLMRFNLPEYTKQRIKLNELYCLPDPRSPIRQLPLSARVFLGICAAWLVALVVSTIVYSCHKRNMRDLREINEQARAQLLLLEKVANGCVASASSAADAPAAASSHVNDAKKNGQSTTSAATEPLIGSVPPQSSGAVAQMRRLSKSKLSSSCGGGDDDDDNDAVSTHSLSAWLNESPLAIRALQALSIKETLREFQKPPRMLDAPGALKKLRVNLNALDAIKCLCCVLVIFGHIIFIHMQHLSNIIHTIELSYGVAPRLLCAFFNFVDTFFIISGMLTAYFIFKRFNVRTFANPLIWLSISLLRLLRLSPVYILVLWFIKTTSVYMSHGPVWDYGTDEQSIKGLCMNDHWWKSILYFGNLGTMQPLCILPAWSIIVDAQYSLVLPAIIFVLFKSKRLGYLLLVLATIVSSTKMTIQLANQTAVRTSDMAKIRLHVYPLISRFAAEFYNTAWNRMGPVAIGIFGGHMLYLYEIGTIKRWPRLMRGPAFKLVLLLHVLIFLLPTIGLYIDNPESADETNITIFILSNATIKPIWSVINTILLLRLITDLRAHSVLVRLMSHNIWHCLGKLCFTSYLIHYEIILTMLKSRQEGLIDPNWSNALREFSAVFLISTVISYVIYILYEAPVNKLIMLVFARHTESLKRTNAQQLQPSTAAPAPADATCSPKQHMQTQTSDHSRTKSYNDNYKLDIVVDHSAMLDVNNRSASMRELDDLHERKEGRDHNVIISSVK